MSARRLISLIALFILTTINAHAGIEKDDKTLSIFGTLTSDDFGDEMVISAAGGYFYTDTLELQGVILLINSEDDLGNVSSIGGYGVNTNLYFPASDPDLIPYIGAGVDLLVTDFNGISDSSVGFNAQVGFKHFLNEDISIDYQAQTLQASDYDAFILSVGISIFLE